MSGFTYTIQEKDVDAKLSIRELLRRNFHFSSRLLTKLRQQELVLVNGKPVRGYVPLKAGDVLTVTLPRETSGFTPEDVPIKVIFEDESLLIVDKQPGVVVHPTKGNRCGTIANGIAMKSERENRCYKIRFANRLDMNTSGLLIVAKNSFVQEEIIKQMRSNRLKKRYLAVVDGIIEEDRGTVDSPIGKPDPDAVERWLLPVSEGGFESVTHYRVLRRFSAGYTLVEISLDTGRTHQIRIHMASIGHPVTGDHLYNNGDPFLYRRLHPGFVRVEGPAEESTSPLIGRQALHACGLSFTHPMTGEALELSAPLPEDMRQLIEKLKDIDNTNYTKWQREHFE